MTHISYQLYCSRNFPPLDQTLAMLAATGYREVEGYGGVIGDAPALKAELDRHGLTMTSCHMGLDDVRADPAAMLAKARAIGIGKVFVPHIQAADRPTDSAGWRALGAELDVLGQGFRDAGLVFGWHNHDFEFEDTPEGDKPLDLILEGGPGLMLELDLGWVRVAGLDPVDWIGRHADRIAAVHVKDIAPDGDCTDEDGWADVGHGIMDWPAIHAALQAAGVDHYVAEHDNPNDHARFARRTFAAISAF